MYCTVIKHSSQMRTLEKYRKHSPAARVFFISLVFSNSCRVLSQCNTWLRLLYLLIILWLAPWVGKMNQIASYDWLPEWARMDLFCPLGTTHYIPQEKFPWKPYSKFFIAQACLVKMARYWPRSFFVSLWTSTSSQSINTQKRTRPIFSHLDLTLGQ